MQKLVISTGIVLSVFVSSSFAGEQSIADMSDAELQTTILQADSKLFDQGFNQCKFAEWNDSLAENLEFYDDRSGLNMDRDKEVSTFKEKCNTEVSVTRKLINTEVHRLNGFGAVQLGKHAFFENGVSAGEAQFVHIWRLDSNKGWQITRAVSYDH